MKLTKGQKVKINATVIEAHGGTVKVQVAAKGGVLVGTLSAKATAALDAPQVASDQETTPILDFQETTPILD